MAFTDEIIQAVWEKGRRMPDWNPAEWCQDQCGAWLHREQYNNTTSEFGWRILNTAPAEGNDLKNLHPFHCNNAFDVAHSKPQCRIMADRGGLAPTQSAVVQPRNTEM